MQAEVAATLDAIIRRTERAKDLLAEARNLGVELDPDRVTQAFEEIGRDRVARLLQDCVNCWLFFHHSSQTEPGREARRESPTLSLANPLPVSSIPSEEDGQVELSWKGTQIHGSYPGGTI